MTENKVVAVSIIDRNNELIFFWNLQSDSSCYEISQLQTFSFCCLDIIEERQPKSEMFLGHLKSINDLQLIGYVSNTQTKLILICNESSTSDIYYKDLIVSLYNLFISTRLNPFQSLTTTLQSKSLATNIENSIKRYLQRK